MNLKQKSEHACISQSSLGSTHFHEKCHFNGAISNSNELLISESFFPGVTVLPALQMCEYCAWCKHWVINGEEGRIFPVEVVLSLLLFASLH